MKRKNVFYFINIIILFTVFFPHITSASTFPENDAGISAYVKLSGMDESNNVVKLVEALAFIESEMEEENIQEGEKTHIIGRIPIEIKVTNKVGGEPDVHLFNIYPYIYLDLDGWLVAYLEKDVPASRIIQWTGYSPENGLETTVLEEAIEKVITEINLDYSTLKYYHFQHKDAGAMTVVIDTVYGSDTINNFAATVPDTIQEASYSVYYSRKLPDGASCSISLKVYSDSNSKFTREKTRWCGGEEFEYGFYPLGDVFSPGIPYSVVTKDEYESAREMRMGGATVFLY